MTRTAAGNPVETMLAEILDRQRRGDSRLDALEVAVARLAVGPDRVPLSNSGPISLAPSRELTDTVPVSKLETPPLNPWPRREVPAPVSTSHPTPTAAFNPSRSGGVIRTPTPRVVPTADTLRTQTPLPPLTPPRPPALPAVEVVTPAAVLASLDDVVWSVSPDGRLVFFLAGAVEKLFGRTAQALRDRPGLWLQGPPPDDRGLLLAALRRLPETNSFDLEHRLERPDGGTRWVVTRGRLVRGPDGRPARVDGSTADVTARTGTDRALAAVVQGVGPATGGDFLEALVEHLAIAADTRTAFVAEFAPDPTTGRTVAAWSDGARAKAFGFPTHAGVGRELAAGTAVHVPAKARDRHPGDALLLALRAEAFAAEPLFDAAGTPVGLLAAADDRPARPHAPDLYRLVRLLAPRAAAELARRAPPVPPARLKELEATFAESERRRVLAEGQLTRREEELRSAEESLRQARKLETVGRLVAGVSHDFNNLLTLICGNAELVREGLPPGDKHRDAADQVIAAGHSAAGLTRQLLALARPVLADPRPVDLNAVVRGIEKMARRLAGDGLTLTVHLAPAVEIVRADPAQVEQVVFNLVANARDAIGAGPGAVVVRTADCFVEPHRPGWPADLPPGGYVALTVSDTGCGMTDEVKARAFDPFFTTKSADKGTGLGLANVRDSVRHFGGHVEVESTVGWGTSVRVYWPKLAAAVPDTVAELTVVPVGPQHLGRGETVLLVEDEESVRDLARSALQQAGYRVLEAADADVAEERARLYAGAISLLVADVGLPRRDGTALAGRLRQTRPGLKVLYVSGYPLPDRPSATGEFLAKPYTPQRLLEVVREVIGRDREE